MKKMWTALLYLAVLAIPCYALCAEDGLLVHYTFDEGSGTVLRDKSGLGHDGAIMGGAKWVKGLSYSALSFNGTDAFVEGPTNLPISKAATLEIWCYPRKFGGGLISWHSGDEQRLSMKYDIYGWNNLLCTLIGNKTYAYIEGSDLPADYVNCWSHLVLAFDEQKNQLFRNGKLQMNGPGWAIPDIKGLPMLVGLGSPLGLPYFDGLIAEVKVYDRALSESEVAAHFSQRSKVFETNLPRTLNFTPRMYGTQKKLVVEADLSNLTMSSGTIEAQLVKGSKVLQKVKRPFTGHNASVAFKTDNLATGDYTIKCTVKDAKGSSAKAETKWHMPKLAAAKHVMNNLVAELVNLKSVNAKPRQEVSFINPRKGWVFVSCEASLSGNDAVMVAAEGAVEGSAIKMTATGPSVGETMCYLPEGPGKLILSCDGDPVISRLIVRSIPELMFCGYPYGSFIKGFGDYNFEFLKKDVLPNTNTIVASYGRATVESLLGVKGRDHAWVDGWNHYTSWANKGRRWLQEGNIPSVVASTGRPTDWNWLTNPTTPDQAFDWWTKTEGLTQPEFSGFVADEWALCQGLGAPVDTHPYLDPRYRLPAYTEAIKRISADQRFNDRTLYAWCGGLDRALTSDAKEFVETVISAGGKVAEEHYLNEPLTEKAANEFLYDDIRRHMDHASALFPNLVENLIFVPGIGSVTPESQNVDPSIDFKVWMDIQMRYMATSPEFFGLGGIMWYHISYADEEAVRWMGQLYRHYAIEGKKDLLSPSYGYKYKPGIIVNADFDEGLKGWTTSEAEPGTLSTGYMHELGRNQIRAHRYEMGRNFLLMKRSAAKPNTASQVITNLTPGKLYSAKMLNSDYQALLTDVPSYPMNARLSIDEVEMVPEKCIVSQVQSFVGPYWFDYHRAVFRAKGPTAKLTITDWAADGTPGGTIGQEVMCNFIEVQPYFE